jgi:hypothetical protein
LTGEFADVIVSFVTLKQIRSYLIKMKGMRRWKTVARELGVSASHLSEVMHDKQTPNSAMLKSLGLKRVVKVIYQKDRK